MSTDTLRTELHEGWARLTLARPERRNALNTALLAELAAALTRLDADAQVRVVVIAGADGHFAAGADIGEIATKTTAEGRVDLRKDSWAAIRGFSKPLIAAVEGYCLGGGCELALMSDIMIVAPDAQLGLPETNLGIIPGAGGAERLTALIGRARAMRMVLSGEIIPGSLAHDWGMAAFLAEDVQGEAEDLARRLARRAPLALMAAKRAVVGASESPLAGTLAATRTAFEDLLDSADKAEGIAAFGARRHPVFTGR
ncbi:2,3-dehydroadipyl-CoA hydratase (plasmid) [Paroceanicella profunda]|uniref:2,3-dehydroadipyl-CoA hydratase n=2 Tax=Paroceanicella profunda TaxID=2579971 RepID=A0A5B8G498_9RHOB|nr:2,3-dehydroadipyl-CoA hydratase [Paroceanicella profunda]